MTAAGGARDIDADVLAREMLRGRLERFRHWRCEVDDRPPDEAVHQLRVAARRLQAALRICAPLCEFPPAISPAPLRRIERRFGALRDLDVLSARLATEPAPGSPQGVTSLRELRDALEGDRVAAGRKAAAAVDRRRLSRLLDALDEWTDSPAFTPIAGLSVRLVAPDLLLPVLGRALIHAGWLTVGLPEPQLAAARPLHALRRRLKALRYAVECFSDWYGEPVTGWLNELHAMQDALGSWHDEGLLLLRLEHLDGLDTLREAALARSREALSPWPAWRDRYLDPGVRGSIRRLLEGAQSAAPGSAGRALSAPA